MRLRDDDEPVAVLQGIEGLAAERVALHRDDLYRPWARFAAKHADDGLASLGTRICTRKIVEAFGETLIDRIVMGALRLDHVPEGSEGLTCEGFDSESHFHERASG